MAKKTMCFDLSSSSIKIKELMQTKDFIMIELWAISDEYPNNNTSHFPYNTMKTNVENKVFYNKPILGKFNNFTLNYEVHNSRNKYDPEYDIAYKDYEDGERPLGVIRESDNVRIETDENGLHWIVFTAILWVKYNYQGVKKILKSRTSKVSVEVTVYESHEDENGIEIFDNWMFDGVTILGYRPNTQILAKEGINNAHLTILEKMGQSEFSHQIKSLQFAYDEFDKNNDIKENGSHLYIEKNEEEEGIELLTYEQKRDLLQEVLHTFLDLEKEWGYVCDLDDNNAFFRVGDVMYRASYSMNEDGTDCILAFDEKVRVINSWKDFEEELDEISNEEGSKEFEEKKKEEDESCGGDSNCQEESNEGQDQEMKSDEDIDDSEDTDDKDEEDLETKEESKLDGEAFDNIKDDDKDSEGESEECSEDEEIFKKEDNDKDDSDEIKMDSEQKFIIEDVEYTAQELFEKYNSDIIIMNELKNNYDSLMKDFEESKKQCTEYETKLRKFENEKMSVLVKARAEKAGFSEEEVHDFVNKCIAGEFESLDEAIKSMAYHAFTKEDNLEKNIKEQTEFSAKAADDYSEYKKEKSNKSNNPFDELKKYVK